jgi:hypothetical protein
MNPIFRAQAMMEAVCSSEMLVHIYQIPRPITQTKIRRSQQVLAKTFKKLKTGYTDVLVNLLLSEHRNIFKTDFLYFLSLQAISFQIVQIQVLSLSEFHLLLVLLQAPANENKTSLFNKIEQKRLITLWSNPS